MISEKLKKTLDRTPKYKRWFIDYSMEIASQIYDYLKKDEKINSQKKLAEKLGKKESEISKWLSGNHNFTIETIAKISEVFNKKILLVPMYALEDLEVKPDVYVITLSAENQTESKNLYNLYNMHLTNSLENTIVS